jgi:hypothetical protein
MHKYGKSLILEDVTAGKVLWKVEPRVAADGEIESISVGSFWKKGGIPLRADHVYRLTVNYDNSTGELIPDGGMGALGGVFIPEPGEDWPEVAKEDSQYLADLRYQRAGGTGMGDEMQAAAGATDASAEAAPGERAGDSDDRAGDEHAGTASTGAPAMRSAGAEHHP